MGGAESTGAESTYPHANPFPGVVYKGEGRPQSARPSNMSDKCPSESNEGGLGRLTPRNPHSPGRLRGHALQVGPQCTREMVTVPNSGTKAPFPPTTCGVACGLGREVTTLPVKTSARNSPHPGRMAVPDQANGQVSGVQRFRIHI